MRELILMTSAFAAALLLAGCSGNKAAAKLGVETKPVVLAGLTESTIGAERDYSAILAPDAQTELSFRIPGYVSELLQVKGADGRPRAIESGMAVASGAVLARIRGSEYQAAVDRAEGAHAQAKAGIDAAKHHLEEAQAGARQAELDFSRIEILWRQESITKPAYDGSLAKRDAALAAVRAAEAAVVSAQRLAESLEAQVREAKVALGDTALTAPYAGVILERRVEAGSLVAPGMPAFTLADLRRVKAKFNVPDAEVSAFRVGQTLPVRLAALERQISGRVLAIAKAADPKSRSFEVQIILDNPGGRLSAGMIATVTTRSSLQEPGLAAPAAAVLHDPVSGRDHVFVAGSEQGKLIARYTPVEVTAAGSAQVRVIRGGLDAKDRVVVSGAMLLQDGDVIHEVRP